MIHIYFLLELFLLQVDVYGWRRLTCVFEWIGKHSLTIFVLVTSNIIVIMAQGFYLKSPNNNIVSSVVIDSQCIIGHQT